MKDDETIPLIDAIQPALRGEKPLQLAVIVFCISLGSMFLLGTFIGALHTIELDSLEDPVRTLIILGCLILITAGLTLVSTMSFLKRLRSYIHSLHSKEDSQKAGGPAQHKSSPHSSRPNRPEHPRSQEDRARNAPQERSV